MDDLWCEIITESIDPDGNAVTYTFDWTVDGVAYNGSTTTTTYSGDTIPGSATVVGELWKCTVTPNDGTEDGYTDSDSVTVTGCNSLYVPNGTYAEISSIAGMLPTGDACYEAWVNTDGSGYTPDRPYLMSITASADTNFGLRCLYGNTVEFWMESGAGNWTRMVGNYSCNDGQWHHIAGCKQISGNTVYAELYWDGNLIGSSSGSTNTIGTNTTIYIGHYPYSAQVLGLGGYIDDIRISDTLRYSGNFVPPATMTADANTVALYRFDTLNGSTFSDSSGNGYSGQVYGASVDAVCH